MPRPTGDRTVLPFERPKPGLTISEAGIKDYPQYLYVVTGLTSNHPGATAGLLFYVTQVADGYQCVETFKAGLPDPELKASTLPELAKALSTRYNGIPCEVVEK